MNIDNPINEYTFDDRDEFNRKSIADNIYSLIDSNIDISPLIINGDWGVGKTEFCHKTINLINSSNDNKVNSIYIDAFKYDHIEQPLITIISEILKALNSESHKENYKKLLTKAAQVSAFFLKTGGKAVVSHLLKQNFNTLSEDLKEVIGKCEDAFFQYAATAIESHVESEKNIEDLRDILKNIAEENKLIIFIDELDRCKPSYALSMLEVIKHIFDIKGIFIVIVTNIDQLKSSVKHAYGNSIDAEKYLEKFAKFTITLPNYMPKINAQYNLEKVKIAHKHFANSVNESTILTKYKNNISNSNGFILIDDYIKHAIPSLRSIEKLVRYLEVYFTLSAKESQSKKISSLVNYSEGFKILAVLSILIYCFNSNLFKQFQQSKVSIDDLSVFLGVNKNITLQEISQNNFRDSDIAFWLIKIVVDTSFYSSETASQPEIMAQIKNTFSIRFPFENHNFIDDVNDFFRVFQELSLVVT